MNFEDDLCIENLVQECKDLKIRKDLLINIHNHCSNIFGNCQYNDPKTYHINHYILVELDVVELILNKNHFAYIRAVVERGKTIKKFSDINIVYSHLYRKYISYESPQFDEMFQKIKNYEEKEFNKTVSYGI